jgi:hypothetical protein
MHKNGSLNCLIIHLLIPLGDFPPEVKQPGREADHHILLVPGQECVALYIHPSQYVFMAWCLVKAQGQLYLYLNLVI